MRLVARTDASASGSTPAQSVDHPTLGSDTATPLVPLLRRAAATASEQLRNATTPAGAEDLVAALRSAVASLIGARTASGWGSTAKPVAREVIDALRASLLSPTISNEADPVEVVELLRAIEQLPIAQPRQQEGTPALDDEAVAGNEDLGLVVEVAHDLRSPLGSILFLVETLRAGRSGPVTQLQERQLGLIYGAAFGLSAVVSDLLELARGSERYLEPQPVPFSLAELVSGVCDIVRPIAEEKQLELRSRLPERDARIGQPSAISRILINLATNALKYTSSGSVEIAVTQRSLTRIEFSVSDTGPGMPAHVQDSLYQPFRKHPLARGSRFSSAGLGLSICRRLVQMLDSELTCASEEGHGTRFSFELELPIASAL